jgi:transcriptional regulator with XRE-family HTH domain
LPRPSLADFWTNSIIKAIKKMENAFDNGKIAVAIRTARAAAGWNQQEFADLMKVAKSTVARIETLEIAAKGDFVMRAMRLFRDNGIDVDLMSASDLPIRISDLAIAASVDAIKDETNRRSDRKTGIAALLPNEPE